MNTFCLDDLDECDLVPCKQCHNLFHPFFLNEHFHCETCNCQSDEAVAEK